jgi:hypothetical protein
MRMCLKTSKARKRRRKVLTLFSPWHLLLPLNPREMICLQKHQRGKKLLTVGRIILPLTVVDTRWVIRRRLRITATSTQVGAILLPQDPTVARDDRIHHPLPLVMREKTRKVQRGAVLHALMKQRRTVRLEPTKSIIA